MLSTWSLHQAWACCKLEDRATTGTDGPLCTVLPASWVLLKFMLKTKHVLSTPRPGSLMTTAPTYLTPPVSAWVERHLVHFQLASVTQHAGGDTPRNLGMGL